MLFNICLAAVVYTLVVRLWECSRTISQACITHCASSSPRPLSNTGGLKYLPSSNATMILLHAVRQGWRPRGARRLQIPRLCLNLGRINGHQAGHGEGQQLQDAQVSSAVLDDAIQIILHAHHTHIYVIPVP